ncbi:MAG TPA: TlpA disulfide reductase family protein [Pyrinomonadaceae bacterium]|jgi:peroxiredoxin
MNFARLLVCLSFIAAFSVGIFGQSQKPEAENFSAVTMNGQPIELDCLRGKVVVLTFWTTRCAACHSAIPKLNRLTEEYKGQDVVFIGITTDNAAKVQKYLRKTRFDFNILADRFDLLLKYARHDGTGNVDMGFPTHFLVNQNGEIEFRTSGFGKIKQLDSGIEQLLNTKHARVE